MLKVVFFFLADVAALQQEDGSFVGDEWGEKDTRYSVGALGVPPACL